MKQEQDRDGRGEAEQQEPALQARDGAGAKSIQSVRTEAGWRISAMAWDDDR